jgi:hypothetical protein
MSDQLHIPASLSPEERHSGNSSPPSVEELQEKTSSLNQGKYNPANQFMENTRSRQTDNLEAPGHYK